MDPMVSSALISAGSSFLSGLGGGQKRPRYLDAVKGLLGTDKRSRLQNGLVKGDIISTSEAQGIHEANMLRAKMASARELGIHPLSMLGIPSSGVPSLPLSGGDGGGSDRLAAASEMGQGISRAVAAYATREEREMAKASSALTLENQQLQNERLRSEIALMHAPGSPPGISGVGSDADARYPAQSHMPVGFGNSGPLYKKGYDEHGNPVRVLNEDVIGDSDFLQTVAALGYSLPDWISSNVGELLGRAHYRYFVRPGGLFNKQRRPRQKGGK